jgi:hypothetical protein
VLSCLPATLPHGAATFTKSLGGTNHSLTLSSPSLPLVFSSAQHSFNRPGSLPFFHSFLPLLPASIVIAVPVPRHSSTWFAPARRSNAQASRDGQPHSELAQRFPPPPFTSLVDAGRLQLLQPHATPIQRIRSVALLVPPRVKSSPLDSRRGAPSPTAATTGPRPILAFVRLIDARATTKRAEPSRIFAFYFDSPSLRFFSLRIVDLFRHFPDCTCLFYTPSQLGLLLPSSPRELVFVRPFGACYSSCPRRGLRHRNPLIPTNFDKGYLMHAQSPIYSP